MKNHRYRVTIEPLDNAELASVSAEFDSHEDIAMIASQIQQKPIFDDANEVTTFAIGVKLFGGIMMRHGKHELFKPLRSHFAKFMKALKQS